MWNHRKNRTFRRTALSERVPDALTSTSQSAVLRRPLTHMFRHGAQRHTQRKIPGACRTACDHLAQRGRLGNFNPSIRLRRSVNVRTGIYAVKETVNVRTRNCVHVYGLSTDAELTVPIIVMQPRSLNHVGMILELENISVMDTRIELELPEVVRRRRRDVNIKRQFVAIVSRPLFSADDRHFSRRVPTVTRTVLTRLFFFRRRCQGCHKPPQHSVQRSRRGHAGEPRLHRTTRALAVHAQPRTRQQTKCFYEHEPPAFVTFTGVTTLHATFGTSFTTAPARAC